MNQTNVAASVIITYYKNPLNLELVLIGLSKQSNKDFEVIIAEDDNTLSSDFVDQLRANYQLSIIHIHQRDLGFRKCRILNEALRVSNADFLIFLDSDCIPNRHFIDQYLKNRANKLVLAGRRVMLGESISNKVKARKSLKPLTLFNILLSKSSHAEEALYLPFHSGNHTNTILGCNFGANKEDLMDINGFDEDYERAGVGEDVDIEWRLRRNGCSVQSVKHRAIVYHLYHKKWYSFSEDEQPNFTLMAEKQGANKVICERGVHS